MLSIKVFAGIKTPHQNPCHLHAGIPADFTFFTAEAKSILSADVEIPLAANRDNPLWVCVTTEDGLSSPIYVFK